MQRVRLDSGQIGLLVAFLQTWTIISYKEKIKHNIVVGSRKA